MKKIIIPFILSFVFFFAFGCYKVKADNITFTSAIFYSNRDSQYIGFLFNSDPIPVLNYYSQFNAYTMEGNFYAAYGGSSVNEVYSQILEYEIFYSEHPNIHPQYSVQNFTDYQYSGTIYINGPYTNNTNLQPQPIGPFVPPEPEPGDDWLSSVWEWFLWQLGLNDDYSGDIDAYITGGDRERMEMVTPSPTPSPTPVPSPTPYSLDIVDNNGNPVYTITGIPGSTYNITNTTNNNDGSDFDIFEVDLKIGDGGSVNPRDGLNDVMDTSRDYLSENVNTSLIGDLFSVIPNDWFLFIGVLAALPFIAGFISKLLK